MGGGHLDPEITAGGRGGLGGGGESVSQKIFILVENKGERAQAPKATPLDPPLVTHDNRT